MQARFTTAIAVLAGVAAASVVPGCSDDRPPQAPLMRAQPVTVLELEPRDFARDTRLTGTVGLYRLEKVGFEVSGRLLWVLDRGKEANGPTLDERGRLVKPGEVIAKLDDTRYRLQVNALRARLDGARQGLEDARAALRLARQTRDRQQRIFDQDAGSRQAVENAQSRFDRMTARNARQQALIREIEQTLQRAEEDLEDCTLRAPFSGRITRIHVSQGAVVEPGRPVVTLSLMDPIQVQVAVSADQDRRLQTGNRAILYPKDPLDPAGAPTQVNAIVYEKGEVAEHDTRTFRIDLIARNERRRVHQIAPEAEGLPVVSDYLPVVRRYHGEPGPLFVPVDSLYREGSRWYVLRLPGVSFHPGARRSAVGKHIPEKIPVSLGSDYFTVIKWNFRSLAAAADLREGDFLVLEPRPQHLTGLAIGRAQWLLRPGELVPVRFMLDAAPKGLYVPLTAITMIDGRHVVFVVENNRARRRAVTVHDLYHELRRIEGEAIDAGTRVIVSGVHYVSDGQPVSVVGQERLPR